MRTFAFALCVFFCSIVGLYIVVDASFRQTRSLVKQNISAIEILAFLGNYYLYNLPVIAYDVMPGVVLIAAIFAITLMNKNNEMVPLLASGISVFRVVAPILIISIGITIVQYIVKDKLIPSVSQHLVSLEKKARRRPRRFIYNRDVKDAYGNRFWIPKYDKETATMLNPEISLADEPGKEGLVKREIFALKGQYKRAPDGEEAWFLSDGKVQRSHSRAGKTVDTERVFGEDGMVLVKNARTGEACGAPYVVTDLRPADIKEMRDVRYKDFYSISYLRQIDMQRGPLNWVRVEVWRRYTWPLVNLLLLAIGVPLVVLRHSSNVYWSIGMCLVLCVAFFFVNGMCTYLGEQGALPAGLAALLPFTIFGSVSGLVLTYVRS